MIIPPNQGRVDKAGDPAGKDQNTTNRSPNLRGS